MTVIVRKAIQRTKGYIYWVNEKGDIVMEHMMLKLDYKKNVDYCKKRFKNKK